MRVFLKAQDPHYEVYQIVPLASVSKQLFKFTSNRPTIWGELNRGEQHVRPVKPYCKGFLRNVSLCEHTRRSSL